jgi:hypothetical protein
MGSMNALAAKNALRNVLGIFNERGSMSGEENQMTDLEKKAEEWCQQLEIAPGYLFNSLSDIVVLNKKPMTVRDIYLAGAREALQMAYELIEASSPLGNIEEIILELSK